MVFDSFALRSRGFLAGLLFSCVAALSGCVMPMAGLPQAGPSAEVPPPGGVATASGRPLPASSPILGVAARMEPVIEHGCRQRLAGRNCDFLIAVDDDLSQPANAFQTLDPSGRPLIIFTAALLNMARNADELAFVMGHEAAHHISGHIPRREDHAMTGAILIGILGQTAGLSGAELARAQNIGAGLAAQHYSKDFELEADALGAELALNAGYDPLQGAEFFSRLPDPGDRFMGSHPSNAERKAVIAASVRRLRGY